MHFYSVNIKSDNFHFILPFNYVGFEAMWIPSFLETRPSGKIKNEERKVDVRKDRDEQMNKGGPILTKLWGMGEIYNL